MTTLYEAIINAFKHSGKELSIEDVSNYIQKNYSKTWSDIGTTMADMVPEEEGGNSSSNVPTEYRVLKRVIRGIYTLK